MDNYNFNPIVRFCLQHGLSVEFETWPFTCFHAVVAVRGKGKSVRLIWDPYYDEYNIIGKIRRNFDITEEDRIAIGRTWTKND